MKKYSLQTLTLLFALVFSLSSCFEESKEFEPIDDDKDPVETPVDDPVEEEVNIKWENWYLSVPLEKENGKATSIYPDIITADGLTDEQNEFFYQNEDGSYTMYTKFTGYTTSGYSDLGGGKYCRTELREFWKGNPDTNDNWYMQTGTHVLETTLKVDYCEGSGQTYVAQIHGKETEGLEGSPATIKIQWKDGDIVVEYYVKPSDGVWTSDDDEKITIATVDNEIFTMKLKVEGGKFYYGIECEAKDIDIPFTELYDYVGNGYAYQNYFKTGNYFKYNKDYEKSAQVVLYKVVTEHLD
ncbi:polysaccharide lyase family 7 protein [Sediminitomix flava]|uniref:Alginate lyase n=1 Tax=Sediminitomix flava TaxID=379075 RepID=A0A315ZFR8_SEDFL|nr:polysaccharide lyase family 7 protein [Sediminitomix flava]PWJ44003.1 alginate lyase [Sediminitomix flava]